MIKKLKKIWQIPFVKNISYLISGTAIAQAIGILISPILSRYYSVADFGALGTIVTLSMILVSFSTLKFELAIVQAKPGEETEKLTFLSVVSALVILTLSFFILRSIPSFFSSLGIAVPRGSHILFSILLALLLSLDAVMVQWNNSKKNYGLLSKKAVVGKGSTSLFQLIWAVSIVSGIGLIYGNLLGATLAMVLVTYPYIRQMKTFRYSFAELKAVALKHYRYAIYTAPQNVLNAVSQGLPVLMLGRFFSDVEVGAYFFTMRILQLPSALIGGAVRQVFYKEAADLKSDLKALRNKFQKVTLLLFAGILVPMIVMFFTGPALFSFIFGEEWREAGVYASWMFLWVGLMFVNPPASAMYFILNKQSKQLIYEVGLFVARFAALFHFGQTQDILLTIQVYSCIGVFFNIVYITYISIVLHNESLNRG